MAINIYRIFPCNLTHFNWILAMMTIAHCLCGKMFRPYTLSDKCPLCEQKEQFDQTIQRERYKRYDERQQKTPARVDTGNTVLLRADK